MRDQKKEAQEPLGADAAAVDKACPLVPASQLPHDAPWHVQGSVVKCDVGGFKMVWSVSGGPPVAYVAALDDAHLIAAAPELLAELKWLVGVVKDLRADMDFGFDDYQVQKIEALIAKAGRR